MIIKGVEHVSINVSDIAEATKFYRDILGFPYLETVSDEMKDLVYFAIPGSVRLELFNYRGKAVRHVHVDSDIEPLGYVHLAFLVDDVDQWVKHFTDHDVPITYGPENLPSLGMRVCLFTDPDGNTLEICEPLGA